MAVIGLVGPHAIGKTTAVYRWLDKWQHISPPKMLGVIADDQWEAESRYVRTRVREWKGDTGQKAQLVAKHQAAETVSVIDSVRTTNLNYFSQTDPVIIVTCSWMIMDQVLRARCIKNDKTYNEAYWDQWKLDYESHKRYLNFAGKKLSRNQWTHFHIEDQARDWPAVDEFFDSVFLQVRDEIMNWRQQ